MQMKGAERAEEVAKSLGPDAAAVLELGQHLQKIVFGT